VGSPAPCGGSLTQVDFTQPGSRAHHPERLGTPPEQNLKEFPEVIRNYRLLVTYNGKCFGVPFIERYFGIRLEQAQLDLRYILR
jgi:hypothetical protein